jgi:hypothetical protein
MLARWLIAGTTLWLAALAPLAAAQDVMLVPFGSTWRYLDDGAAAPANWFSPGFDDSGWEQGPGQLGYGDGDEATVIGFGPNPQSKPITYYFRYSFPLAQTGFAWARARLRRDDGAVIYVNGVEVGRYKLPLGTILPTTVAQRNVSPPEENWITDFDFDPALLQVGSNVLAVEIHQNHPANDDVSFDLELWASPDPHLIRGPYLQLGTPTSVVVRFRTSVPVPGRVRYGADPNALTSWVDGPSVKDHSIQLAGLGPGTRYFYSVGTPTVTMAGGNAEHFFRTSPPVGAKTPQRIWVIGDSGNGNQAVRDVLQDYLAFTGTTETSAWLLLGDNAYDSGSDGEYQEAFFSVFPALLRSSVVWPSFGNHETPGSNSLTQTGPYFDAFTLPAAGQAGGLASGSEAYYSFDRGNVHFLVLDAHATDRSPQGAMMTWAAADLAQTQQDFAIAYFHHAPYSKGTHDTDDPADSGGQLIDVREKLLPVLEAGGVDLVLTGHSHSYERSMLIDGHYGFSWTFGSQHQVDPGDGCICSGPCPDCPLGGTGPYLKSTQGPTPHSGTLYPVVGSSSLFGSLAVPFPHPVMVTGLHAIGAMVIDVQGSRLDARWIERGGIVRDRFTLLKGGDDDADLWPNPDDNCRYTPNGNQADAGRLLLPIADGIGDVCQCGDVAHGGIIDAADAQALREYLAGDPGALDGGGIAKCGVVQPGPACDERNLVVLRRALAAGAPGIAQACAAAQP